MTKRSFSLLVAMILAVSLLGGTGVLADGAETEDAQPDYAWFESPDDSGEYKISSPAQLVALANLVNEGLTFAGETIKLTQGIDLTGIDWVPIGGGAEKISLDQEITDQATLTSATKKYGIIYDEDGNSYSGSTGEFSQEGTGDLPYNEDASYYYVKSYLFSGTFDGGNYEIKGLNVTSDLGYLGLFGNVNGTLKNFTVSGTVTYTGSNGDYVGGVAGMLAMGGTISNVTSNVTVGAGRAYNVGGIVGFVGTPLSSESAGNTFVTMCVNNGTVTGYNKVGGIAGENAGIVSLCVNNASKIAANGGNKVGVGGIVGRNGNNNTAIEAGTVINCYNTGAVSALKWSGGIVGFNNIYSRVENCYVTMCPARALSYSNPIVGEDESCWGKNGTLVRNNYALNYEGLAYTGTEEYEVGILLESDELQKAAYDLGGAYRSDPSGGYPELAWMLDCKTVAFEVGPAEAQYTVRVTDGIGVQVAPESDGSFLLVDGQTYDYTVSATGYRTVAGSLTVKDGEKVSVTLPEVIGPVVTVNNATGPVPAATVTGLISGLDYVPGSLTFHVDCNRACVVAYSTDGGATYTRLTAEASEGGGYDFTIDLTADAEIAVALKGDLNLNGTVNGADALQVQRATVGLISLTPLQKLAADVNGNESVNGADALQIQRSVVSLTAFAW